MIRMVWYQHSFRLNCSHRLRFIAMIFFIVTLHVGVIKSEEAVDGEEDEYQYAFHYQALDQVSIKVDPLKFNDASEVDFSEVAMEHISSTMQNRMKRMFLNTKTPECRALITEHMARFVNAIALEVTIPYSEFEYEVENTCPDPIYNFDDLPNGLTVDDVMARTYDAPTATFVSESDQLQLLYIILAHNNAERVIRLIETLQIEDAGGTDKIAKPNFVIHIDKKVDSDDTYRQLSDLYSHVGNVYILPDDLRVSINWGGFNMVQATLNCLKFIFCVDPDFCSTDGEVPFDKIVHLASTSYPIKSNSYIREKISQFPLDAKLFDLIMQPNVPAPDTWHYFVECDDRIHRLYRLKSFPRIYTGSQWFIMSYDFAEYMARGLNDQSR